MIDYAIYESANKRVKFDLKSDTYIVTITGISELTANLASGVVYGVAGDVINDISINPRYINILARIKGELDENRKHILDVFDPYENGKLVVSKNGVEYYIDVNIQQTPMFNNKLRKQDFSIILKASNPIWKTSEFTINQFSIENKEFMFPKNLAGEWYITRFDTSPIRKITNIGNREMGMVITFEAKSDVVNPSFRDLNTQKFIKFNYTLQAGDSIIATVGDKKNITIYQNDVEINGFKYLTEDSSLDMYLSPGENTFGYYADANASNLEVSVPTAKGALNGI